MYLLLICTLFIETMLIIYLIAAYNTKYCECCYFKYKCTNDNDLLGK